MNQESGMGLFDGKKGLILGVANERSIAWAIAKRIMEEGGQCGFTHLHDRPDDEKKKNRRRVAMCTEDYDNAKFLLPCDVQSDEDIQALREKAEAEFGTIDFIVHSVAFADRHDLTRDTIETSRDGFKLAMDVSVYSLIAVANAMRDIMNENGAILTMTYLGGEKCVPGYNVMGICKAALDATIKYLAYDLGLKQVRVNAISAGPLKTLAASLVGAGGMQALYEKIAPLGRNITHDEVGKTATFLLSDQSSGITGEIVHVDAGYSFMGSPGRLLDELSKHAQ
jgi:enoyl-[acyl-carrier protein] reductase I